MQKYNILESEARDPKLERNMAYDVVKLTIKIVTVHVYTLYKLHYYWTVIAMAHWRFFHCIIQFVFKLVHTCM